MLPMGAQHMLAVGRMSADPVVAHAKSARWIAAMV